MLRAKCCWPGLRARDLNDVSLREAQNLARLCAIRWIRPIRNNLPALSELLSPRAEIYTHTNRGVVITRVGSVVTAGEAR